MNRQEETLSGDGSRCGPFTRTEHLTSTATV
jgi:hypothetical protein